MAAICNLYLAFYLMEISNERMEPEGEISYDDQYHTWTFCVINQLQHSDLAKFWGYIVWKNLRK